MKENSNLLILGAGASMDYGFPSGTDLKERAIALVANNKTTEYSLLVKAGGKMGFDHTDLLIFKQKLKKANLDDSIDAFIEANNDDQDIEKLTNMAKCIIALLIATCEDPKKLFETQPSWYYELFKKMYTGRNSYNRFFENKLNCITFNYDRSLEEFLLTTVAKQFGKPQSDCIKDLSKNFQVVHVHGSLGDIWKSKSSPDYRDYSPTLKNADDLVKAANKIRLITDEIDPMLDSEFTKANSLIRSSDTVHFIGFGYHVNNMERIGFADPSTELLGPIESKGSIAINGNRDDKFFGTIKGINQQKVLECVRKYYLNTVAYSPSAGSDRYGLARSVDDSVDAFEYVVDVAPFD